VSSRSRRLACLAILAIVPASVAAGCGGDDGKAGRSERSRAIASAINAYEQAKSKGTGLGRGPCIAERLPGLPDWVADVAHDPRQAVDEVPANQCRRFREGEASHFVEIAPNGKLIRAE
jgi:hypothetical protein